MGCVATSEDEVSRARERLNRLMDERRADLRLRWADVATRAGLTKEGLRGVRQGPGSIRSLTKRGIEDALRWAPGSIDSILSGGTPTIATDRPRLTVHEGGGEPPTPEPLTLAEFKALVDAKQEPPTPPGGFERDAERDIWGITGFTPWERWVAIKTLRERSAAAKQAIREARQPDPRTPYRPDRDDPRRQA